MIKEREVLVVGAGMMAKEYCKVLKALEYRPLVVGRGEENARKLAEELQVEVLWGGLAEQIGGIGKLPEYAIVASNMDQLAASVRTLLEHGIRHILVEKPAGMNRTELEETEALVQKTGADVCVGYNRRFYASTQKAQSIIEEDGGVSSYSFEFTEWGHVIRETKHPKEIKENWFLANSTHVADLAFYLGGFPKKMDCYVSGSLDWHSRGSVYAGAGVSEKGALFSYQANWGAPGRWAVEILTAHHRLYLKPMEKLQIQKTGSVAVEAVELEDRLDTEFKPGLYQQTRSFLEDLEDGRKLRLSEQLAHMRFYEQIEGMHGDR